MSVVVSTWMYTVPDGDGAVHFQIGKRSDTQEARNHYWRCLFCLFASARAHMPDCRCVLLYNTPPPDFIDDKNVHDMIRRLRIELVQLETTTRPPKDYHPAWNTQFIVLDALDQLRSLAEPEDAVLLLDGDCIFVRPLSEEELSRIASKRALLYTLPYDINKDINGLTAPALTALSKEYDPPATADLIRYSGGEFVCLSGAALAEVAPMARSAYEQSLSRHEAGQEKFREEAHLLSYVYSLLGFDTHSGNDIIKRIWTDGGGFRNVDGSEDNLAIWHLPAEKKRGFRQMFAALGSSENELSLFYDRHRLDRLFRIRPGLRASLRMGLVKRARPGWEKVRQYLPGR